VLEHDGFLECEGWSRSFGCLRWCGTENVRVKIVAGNAGKALNRLLKRIEVVEGYQPASCLPYSKDQRD
jgi:hypothetical protein